MQLPATLVRYTPDLERPEEDEAGTIAALKDVFRGMLETTSKDYAHAVRGVHAKGHAIATGTLTVLPDLPPQLAQGLFARPGDYDAIVRFSTNPADILDDSVVVPRGLALRVRGVDGGTQAQDFIMVDGPAFFVGTAKAFLQNLKLLAATTDKIEGVKKAQSAVFRAIETALETVGLESATLKNLGGSPSTHPLGRTYYSQTPFRYGDYVAKFSVAPVSPNLKALEEARVAVAGRPDALREDVNEALVESDSIWELRVQLCTDVKDMPIENASALWDEEKSPFIPVARLAVPAQPGWQHGVSDRQEDELAFSIWNGLPEHRPLGAINRVRQPIYDFSAEFRGKYNGCPIHRD